MGYNHTAESKAKISKRRKEYLDANPDKVPYLLNHHAKGPSYPERYFKELFDDEGINVTAEFPVGRYSLDFAELNRMIDIEIHGNQHYHDAKIVASDIRRRGKLESLGWHVIEIKWSDYKKLTRLEKETFIDNLKSAINKRDVLDVPVKTKKELAPDEKWRPCKPEIACAHCCQKTKNKKYCSQECSKLAQKRVNITDLEIYETLKGNNFNYELTGRQLGLSGNGIKKRIKNVGDVPTKYLPSVTRDCAACNSLTKNKLYCSAACSQKSNRILSDQEVLNAYAFAGNYNKAAILLGVDRSFVRYRMKNQ